MAVPAKCAHHCLSRLARFFWLTDLYCRSHQRVVSRSLLWAFLTAGECDQNGRLTALLTTLDGAEGSRMLTTWNGSPASNPRRDASAEQPELVLVRLLFGLPLPAARMPHELHTIINLVAAAAIEVLDSDMCFACRGQLTFSVRCGSYQPSGQSDVGCMVDGYHRSGRSLGPVSTRVGTVSAAARPLA